MFKEKTYADTASQLQAKRSGQYVKICQSVARPIAAVPGLRWKVWLLNEHEKEAGGLYLFDTEQALNEYLAGPIVTQVKSHAALRDLSAKKFDVLEEVTAITRGPVSATAAAQQGPCPVTRRQLLAPARRTSLAKSASHHLDQVPFGALASMPRSNARTLM